LLRYFLSALFLACHYVPYSLYTTGDITFETLLICWAVVWIICTGISQKMSRGNFFHHLIFWGLFLPVWYFALFFINDNFEGNIYTALIVGHLVWLGLMPWLWEQLAWLGWRKKTLAEISSSTDVAWLREEFLDISYTAEYLKKAALKRIANLGEKMPELTAEDQVTKWYIESKTFDELRAESLQISREVTRGRNISFIGTTMALVACVSSWILGAPLWVIITLAILFVVAVAISGGFIWGQIQERDWKGTGNILSDDPNDWSDAILRKRAIDVQSQMDEKKPFDEQTIQSSTVEQALEVLGMISPENKCTNYLSF
jgi:hypothetical protein